MYKRVPDRRALRLEALEDRRLLSASGSQQPLQLFDASPALFVANQGQFADAAVRYAFYGTSANVLLTDSGPVFQVSQQAAAGAAHGSAGRPDGSAAPQSEQIGVTFLGANPAVPTGLDQAATVYNYFVGPQSQWLSGVPTFQKVAYDNLYAGIDLETWGQQSSLKYEFHVAPGADYQQIRIHYDGIDGLSADSQGVLHVQTPLGELTDAAPFIYQVIGGQQVAVAGRFQLIDANTYTFTVTGSFDATRELVIDPALIWSTYVGGNNTDYAYAVSVDSSGNSFVAGETYSPNFAGATNSFHAGGSDAFVAKVNSGGTVAWATYLGGSGDDWGTSVAVNPSGYVFVYGTTASTDFAGSSKGGDDLFVAVLSSGGTLSYASRLGGEGDDYAGTFALHNSGSQNNGTSGYTYSSFYFTGSTDSASFAGTSHGGSDAFAAYATVVTTISGAGVWPPSVSFAWSTRLGGSGDDWGDAAAQDSSGNLLVAGAAESADFAGAINSPHGGDDAFLAKLTSSGALTWAAYVGGSGNDQAYAVALDSSGNALVAGYTYSTDFAGANNVAHGGEDAFVAKVSAGGTLAWETYLGGSGDDLAYGVAVDASGNAVAAGETYSTDFTGANNSAGANHADAFVAKVSSAGALSWATYVGSGTSDKAADAWGYAITLDSSGNILLAGAAWAMDLPQANNDANGDGDAFLTKLTGGGQPLWTCYLGGSGNEQGLKLAVDSSNNALIVGVTCSTGLDAATNAYAGGPYDAFVAKVATDGTLLWTTYFGGSGDDEGFGIAVDGSGNAFICGSTTSSNLPSANNTYRGGTKDGFVAKFISSGALAWSTYLGGSSDDEAVGIAIDSWGSLFAVGDTTSSNFTGTVNSPHGGQDAFLVKLNSGGSVLWARYIGGTSGDAARGVTVDSTGEVYVVGNTYSSDILPKPNSYHAGQDCFVVSHTNDGTPDWAVYLGGTGYDDAVSVAVDASRNVYVCGTTQSSDFEFRNNSYHGGQDAFVAKLANNLLPTWATYLGGSGDDEGFGLVVDGQGNALVTGDTTSTNFNGALNSPYGGDDAFIARVATGGGLSWVNYLGGSGNDVAWSIAWDNAGYVLVTGSTASDDFVGHTNDFWGGSDAFVLKMAVADPSFALTAPTSGTFTAGQSVTIQWTAANAAAGSSINLCVDGDATWNNNETWIKFGLPAVSGSYSWDTTGMAPGTYYIGGYLWTGGKAVYSHLTQSITIQAASQPAFNLTGPTSGTFTAGQPVPVQWTAANAAAGSSVALCYDTGTSFGNATWITFGASGANGSGSYSWNTTGVAAGTYYIGGYLYSGGKPVYSHLTQSINIQANAPAATFTLTAPTSGTFTAGQPVPVQWTAGNVAAGGTVNLCLDSDAAWNGNETWIKFGVAAANGNGSYNWDTTGVAPGTYYIGGYLYSGGKPVYSHLTQSVTIQANAPVATFTLTAPISGAFTAGQPVPVQWTAANVATGSSVNLCLDSDTAWNGNETWIKFGVAAANGAGSYSWDTTGVAPGTYYLGGYLYSGGKPVYSHLAQSITIQANAPAATFALTAPTSGNFSLGSPMGIWWTAGNVAAGSSVNLCLDPDTTWNNNETWIKFGAAAANGNSSYNWTAAGVAPGTYYVAGYLYQGGKPVYSHLTQSITIGAALTLAAPASGQPQQPVPATDVLDNQNELSPILSEAIRRWAAVAGSQEKGDGPHLPERPAGCFAQMGTVPFFLAGVSVQIADLPGNLLGEEIGKTILIDRDAAGYGWFIDPTPQDDSEFTPAGADAMVAGQGTAAQGHADLLTAVMHELGHVLGYGHDAGDGLMNATLPLGVRHPLAVDQALAAALRS